MLYDDWFLFLGFCESLIRIVWILLYVFLVFFFDFGCCMIWGCIVKVEFMFIFWGLGFVGELGIDCVFCKVECGGVDGVVIICEFVGLVLWLFFLFCFDGVDGFEIFKFWVLVSIWCRFLVFVEEVVWKFLEEGGIGWRFLFLMDVWEFVLGEKLENSFDIFLWLISEGESGWL